MKKAKSGYITIALFALAATLLTFSAVGSSRAALTYYSETYGAEVSLQDIGVTLVENGEDVTRRNYTGSDDEWDEGGGKLVGHMLEETDGKLVLGKQYKEELQVRNSGKITQYMRVTIHKYWADNVKRDANGYILDAHKRTDLDPSLIDLELTNLGTYWTRDTSSDTRERTVLYYNTALASGATSEPFSATLTIKGEPILADVKETVESTDGAGNRVITTYYTYDGMEFILQVDVDAVQTHNAQEAIRSAWGVNRNVPDVE